ncbi:unnamed protein product [Penicillium olsonii]|uniref:Cytochrome P450 n=1 Tax=Penicillium olsonii TaxID=99116 RepID=A0A9W4HRW2_PENOL|nr:unnamed protein product [Penicillium olsonii]CAG8100366.1 unnamed protein product [Penicillium olsonii]
MLTITLFVGAAIVVLVGSRILRIGQRPKNYPPGPPTLPLLGNIHQMPTRDAHLQFEKWAREYGPIYSLILGTKCLIVLSSDEAVKELLDKRSGLYSHRPEMYIGQTLCSGNLRLLMMFRKMIHSLLNVTASKKYIPYQMLENRKLLHDILIQPEGFLKHIRRYSNALTTTMVFGWRTPTYEDGKMMQLFDGFSKFADINQTGTAAIIDFFPWLRNLPEFLIPAQKKAKELHRREKALYLSHWLRAKEESRQGKLNPRNAMLLFPDVQRKAQDEIERVIGSSRLPVMEDLSELQYIRACMKETVRWMPTTILGAVPHAVTQDDEYRGMFIPKNAGVLNNVWAIHMDPNRHPNPRTFNPNRYLDDQQSFGDAAANPDPSQRDVFTFGAGRRMCPGIHVAERSLFLGMARILWAFRIEAEIVDGRPVLPDPDRLTQGFVCMPEEFGARITPRSQGMADLVVREWREAERDCLDPLTRQWVHSPVGFSS